MQEQPPEIEKLRQLLALKRHELPPPGYFNDFSSRVIVRIEREQAAPNPGFLRQLAALFQSRPAISLSFCMATGLVLLAATTLLDPHAPGNGASLPAFEPSLVSTKDLMLLPQAGAGAAFLTNLEPHRFVLEIAPATNPAPLGSLFSSPPYSLQAEPVSFSR